MRYYVLVDLTELKRINVLKELGIAPECFPRPLAFIDFANVTHWYTADVLDPFGNPLPEGTSLEIDLRRLRALTQTIGTDARLYYGHDAAKQGSRAFIKAAEHAFGKHRVFTKPIQYIRHDLTPADSIGNTRLVHTDRSGDYVLIPKCNFDVEIAVDAMRLIAQYDTICLFSGDSDFAALLRYLRGRGKKVILFKGGRIAHALDQVVDLKIDAASVRPHIAYVKQTPGTGPGVRG